MYGAVRIWSALVILWCALAAAIPFAAAQDPASSPATDEGGFVRTDFTVDQGLPDNRVNAILQTDNGLLWVATASGLAYFDGHRFTPVELRIPGAAAPESATALALGTNGDRGGGTDAGAVRISRSDLNDPYQAVTGGYRIGKQQSDGVEALFCDRSGTLWAGTNHGLYFFDGKQFHVALDEAYVSRIHQALDGKLILITGNAFMEYDGRRAIAFPGLGRQFGVADNEIFDAFQTSDSTMWYGTRKGVHLRGDKDAPRLAPSPIDGEAIFRIYQAPDRTLWFSTGNGLYRVSGNTLVSPAPGLKSRVAFWGKGGDIWIGTSGNGLVHLQPRLVHTYTMADGMLSDYTLTTLATQDGRIWAGNNCGLSVYDGSHFRTYAEKQGLLNSCVWSLAEDRNHDIWAGTYGGGVFRLHDGFFTQYSPSQGLVSSIVLRLAVTRDGAVWAATPDGLSRIADGRIANYTTADGLSSDRVLDVHEDRSGTLWVATQGGVDRYVAGRFQAIESTPAKEEVLPRRFAEDSLGNLYTTDAPRGLSRIAGNQITLIDRSLDLLDMVETPDHTLWFTSRHGVLGIAEKELAAIGTSDRPIGFRQIDRAEGMISSQASIGAPDITAGSDGRIWVATVRGLAVIDTARLSQAARKATVFVSEARIDGTRNRVGNELTLAPGVHHVELHLDAVDLATAEKTRLQYRLEGVDERWLDADASRTAVYTNLPPGSHRLWVRATDSLGSWGDGRAIYQVKQQPYFYQTKLFQFGAAICLVALLRALYILRVRFLIRRTRTILEQRQAERESVAHDLHDTLLQDMQGLILRFHGSMQKLPADQPARPFFEDALRRSDQVMSEARKALSRLHLRRATPDNLPVALENLGRDLRALCDAEFRVTVSGRPRPLSSVVQEELYRVGREALFNAFRHAEAGHITIEIHFTFFELRLRIRDDGKGIDTATLHDGGVAGHYGMPGMRERVHRIGGYMKLSSSPGAGTEIEVRIPSSIAYVQE